MTWVHCPGCAGDWQRTTKLIPGHTVLRCPRCRTYSIAGAGGRIITQDELSDDQVIELLEDWARRLERDSEPYRTFMAMHGPDDDPRWDS